MKKLSLILAMIMIVLLSTAANKKKPSYTAALEAKIFILVNNERVNHGLKPLKTDSKLTLIARAHSLDMAKRDFTGHVNPDGLDPTGRAKKAGYKTEIIYADRIRKGVGENIAEHQTGVEENGVVTYNLEDVSKVAPLLVTGWMNSPGHRANILNPDYTKVGTGASVSSDKKVRVTQVFF
jgi:uncharacterized protein YkwD